MKNIEYLLGFAIIAGCFVGCETVDSEGRTSRLDPDAINAVAGAGFGLYDRVRASQQPQPRIIGYNQFGQPIHQ